MATFFNSLYKTTQGEEERYRLRDIVKNAAKILSQ